LRTGAIRIDVAAHLKNRATSPIVTNALAQAIKIGVASIGLDACIGTHIAELSAGAVVVVETVAVCDTVARVANQLSATVTVSGAGIDTETVRADFAVAAVAVVYAHARFDAMAVGADFVTVAVYIVETRLSAIAVCTDPGIDTVDILGAVLCIQARRRFAATGLQTGTVPVTKACTAVPIATDFPKLAGAVVGARF
jgi:hypothetical protein